MISGASVSNVKVIFSAKLAVESSKVDGEFMSIGFIVRFPAK